MRRRAWTAVTALGLILLLAAAALTLWNFHEDRAAARSRDSVLLQLAEAMPETQPEPEPEPLPQPAADPGPAAGETGGMPAVPVDGRSYMGVIDFPSLSLELPVLASYDLPSLRAAPAVYSGTPATGDLVICGHNYRSHFGPLNRLEPGDEVWLKTMDGAVYRYKVSATEIVSPFAVEDVTGGDWDLTLFTCTLGGQTRFVVRCDPS